MKTIKFDEVRVVLSSGNVVNCMKKPIQIQAKQMFEDFTIETLEHQDAPYQGKSGDYIMIGVSGEMYVCDQETFEKTYDVKSFWSMRQHANTHEDYHHNTVAWEDTPFNDNALSILRLKKLTKSPDYIKQKDNSENGRNY